MEQAQLNKLDNYSIAEDDGKNMSSVKKKVLYFPVVIVADGFHYYITT